MPNQLPPASHRILNGTVITLKTGLKVTVVADRGYQISVKSFHPYWNGRIFFITPSEIDPLSLVPLPPADAEEEHFTERDRR